MSEQQQQQQEHPNLNEIAKKLADGKIMPEQACSLIEAFRDAGGNLDLEEIDAENEQQKGFHEIAWVLADWKITTEEACDALNEWLGEHTSP
jgi:hypothetical protein